MGLGAFFLENSMSFVLNLVPFTPDPYTTADFLKNALQFQVEYRSGYGRWVENGSVIMILQKGNADWHWFSHTYL